VSRRGRNLRLALLFAPLLAVAAFAMSAVASEAPTSVVAGDAMVPAHSESIGSLPGSGRLRLTVVLHPRDAAALSAFAAAVSDPASPEYRHYLTVGAFAARFGVRPAAVTALRQALRADGLTPGKLAADHLSLAVSGTVATASRAFDVRLQRYREASGREVYSNAGAPRVPAALGGIVQDVLGLSNVEQEVPQGLSAAPAKASAPTSSKAVAHAASSPFPGGGGPVACSAATNYAATRSGATTIDTVGKAYGFDGMYAGGDFGQGVTVALLELEPYPTEASDVNGPGGFQQCFGTDAQITDIKVDGGSQPTETTAESAVDLDNLIGLAPEVNVEVYYGPNGGTGPYDTLAQIVNAPSAQRAQVISDSWGVCEPDLSSFKSTYVDENNLLEQAAAQGQTFFASSGDLGAEGCSADWNNNFSVQGGNSGELAVDDPASQPYATSVGGTTLNTPGPPPIETAWNQEFWGASGGGISSFWPMPAYQASQGAPGVINSYSSGAPCANTTGYCRQVPDVSADGSSQSGYVTFYQGNWSAWGGTSTSAPDWAAVAALADASGLDQCTPSTPLGFLNPLLYEIAAGSKHADAINDITNGSNNSGYFDTSSPPAPVGAYPVTPGYDMVTGLGSPIVTDGSSPGLVAQLCGAGSTGTGSPPTVTSVNPVEASPGATITITGSGFTPYSAVLFGSTPAAAVTFVSATELTATVPAGSGSVAVIVTEIAGVSAQSPSDVFTYAPTETIASPASGATYTQGQSLTASFSCADSTAGNPTCSGSSPNGATLSTSILGSHQFTVTASDGNVTTTTTATYTVIAPPAIAVNGVAPGAVYLQGQALSAQVNCSTSAPVTITTCSAPGRVDTSSTGTYSFSVTATDSNGVSTTDTISYTVVAAPSVEITSPANGAAYPLGKTVTAKFNCSAAAPAQISSCSGTAADGAAINTASAGTHRFTVTATEADGVSATTTVSYTVVSSRPKLSNVQESTSTWAEHPGSGAPVGTSFTFTLDRAASLVVTFSRSARGRVAGGHCVSPLLAPKAAACMRSIASGTVSIPKPAGHDVMHFAGHTSTGLLPPGSYTVVLRAKAPDGQLSSAATLHFTVAS
jgi:subtilase family serine protease